MVTDGGVGLMAVVLDVPDRDYSCPVGLAGPDPGVEVFFGQDLVVALDAVVVPGACGRMRRWRDATPVTVRVIAVDSQWAPLSVTTRNRQ